MPGQSLLVDGLHGLGHPEPSAGRAGSQEPVGLQEDVYPGDGPHLARQGYVEIGLSRIAQRIEQTRRQAVRHLEKGGQRPLRAQAEHRGEEAAGKRSRTLLQQGQLAGGIAGTGSFVDKALPRGVVAAIEHVEQGGQPLETGAAGILAQTQGPNHAHPHLPLRVHQPGSRVRRERERVEPRSHAAAFLAPVFQPQAFLHIHSRAQALVGRTPQMLSVATGIGDKRPRLHELRLPGLLIPEVAQDVGGCLKQCGSLGLAPLADKLVHDERDGLLHPHLHALGQGVAAEQQAQGVLLRGIERDDGRQQAVKQVAHVSVGHELQLLQATALPHERMPVGDERTATKGTSRVAFQRESAIGDEVSAGQRRAGTVPLLAEDIGQPRQHMVDSQFARRGQPALHQRRPVQPEAQRVAQQPGQHVQFVVAGQGQRAEQLFACPVAAVVQKLAEDEHGGRGSGRTVDLRTVDVEIEGLVAEGHGVEESCFHRIFSLYMDISRKADGKGEGNRQALIEVSVPKEVSLPWPVPQGLRAGLEPATHRGVSRRTSAVVSFLQRQIYENLPQHPHGSGTIFMENASKMFYGCLCRDTRFVCPSSHPDWKRASCIPDARSVCPYIFIGKANLKKESNTLYCSQPLFLKKRG